ncbi:MAG: hypothetical protein R2879_17460 [Saprospiraceae bacterium]
MSPAEIENLREKILQQLEKFEGEIVQLEEMTKPIGPENAIGRSEQDGCNSE